MIKMFRHEKGGNHNSKTHSKDFKLWIETSSMLCEVTMATPDPRGKRQLFTFKQSRLVKSPTVNPKLSPREEGETRELLRERV